MRSQQRDRFRPGWAAFSQPVATLTRTAEAPNPFSAGQPAQFGRVRHASLPQKPLSATLPRRPVAEKDWRPRRPLAKNSKATSWTANCPAITCGNPAANSRTSICPATTCGKPAISCEKLTATSQPTSLTALSHATPQLVATLTRTAEAPNPFSAGQPAQFGRVGHASLPQKPLGTTLPRRPLAENRPQFTKRAAILCRPLAEIA